MKVDKALGMIGLATKAGKIASGEFMRHGIFGYSISGGI